ncbi:MAG: Lon protease, partial [Candidatus Daviesbacteria bacterium GW2011_GWA1_36_8]
FGRKKSQAAINAALAKDKLVALFTQKDSKLDDPLISDLYSVGTLCAVERTLKTEGELNALVRGIARIRLVKNIDGAPVQSVEVVELIEHIELGAELEALARHLTSQFRAAVNLGKSVEFMNFMRLMSGVGMSELGDQISAALNISLLDHQLLLENLDLKSRLYQINDFLAKELKVLEIEKNIASKTQAKFSQNMKESFLLVGEEFDSLNAIFDISPREDWVYFNRQFGLGTQKNYLNDIKDRKTAYMADYLKTAKAFTHQGWPGAQVEYNFPSTGNKLEIGNTLYVLPVIGIHQVAGYYRQSGALNTEYIAFEDLLIKRDESGISIEVNSPLNFDFFRLLVDVGVRQFDIEGKRVVSLFKTDVIEQELPQMTQEVTLDLKSSGDINLSLPTYSSYDATTNYIWLNDQMVEANIVRKNNQLEIKSSDFFDRGKIKIYFSNELNYPPEEAPKVSYI